jgi:putative redox protein
MEDTVVDGRRFGNLAAEVVAREHKIVSGVQAKLGGNDEGADPHELLEAALAACTIITVQMYANRKAWDLKSCTASVRVISEGKQTLISREVSFKGELTSDQREKLLEIADKCPIHNLLQSEVKIETKLRGDR